MTFEQAQPISTRATCISEPDPAELVAVDRAIAGDRAAVDWLILRYRTRVVRLATHMLRRPGEAEDAAQEAFIRAFRCLSSYRRDGQFYTWLYSIVVRVCLDRMRLARWKTEVDSSDAACADGATDSSYAEAEHRIVVEALLDRLNPKMRAMLVLREIEGMEYAEIANALNIPIGRVRWRLHTARRQFQTLWTAMQREADNV